MQMICDGDDGTGPGTLPKPLSLSLSLSLSLNRYVLSFTSKGYNRFPVGSICMQVNGFLFGRSDFSVAILFSSICVLSGEADI